MMHTLGLGASMVDAGLREIEISFRGFSRVSRRDPEQELPDVDLPEGERDAALRREAARRMLGEHP